MEAVIRLEWLGLARTLLVVAVEVVGRLARCAWWLWLGSHAVPSAVGALTPRNRFILVPHPKYYLLNGCRKNFRRGKKMIFMRHCYSEVRYDYAD